MPPHYEDAAHMLKMMVTAGLRIGPGNDYISMIISLADAIAQLRTSESSRSHATCAGGILTVIYLTAKGSIKLDPKSRAKVLAVAGTCFGNIR